MKNRCAALSLAFLSPAVFAATITISPGANLNQVVQDAAVDDIIQLNPGTYTPSAPANGCYGLPGSFGIGKRVTIRGLGATPASVILQGTSSPGIDYAVYVLRYACGANPDGARIENLTINAAGSPTRGGISLLDFVNGGRVADVSLKDVVINSTGAGGAFGVLGQRVNRIVADNVTVTAYQSGFYLVDSIDSLIMNSYVPRTLGPAAPAIGVLGGSGNRIVGNTFGVPSPNPTVDANYSFNAGGVVFYNSVGNRFENNLLQGFRDDGLDYMVFNLTGAGVAVSQEHQNSTDNYAGKNTIVSTGFSSGVLGGTGIWSNCSSNNTWIFGNTTIGSPEGGISVWASKSNMVLGNIAHGHGTVGIFVSGGIEAAPSPGGCTEPSDTGAFAIKPINNYVRNNSAVFNRTDQLVIRSSDNTDISMNFTSPRSSRTGTLQPAADPGNGQAGLSFATDSRFASSTGFRFVANITSENMRGLWNNDDRPNTGIEAFHNRIIGSNVSRITVPSTLFVDGGPIIGGNFWSHFTVTGNPSNTAFAGVTHDSVNSTGRVIDRFPFQSDHMGRENNVQVFEPRANFQVAVGTKRTVRWYAPGCVYVDLLLDGATSLGTDVPNLGYYVVTIPSVTAGTHLITVQCKDSGGVVIGSGNSPVFNITSSSLQLRAPGRDDTLSAGSSIFVAWKKAVSVGAVNVTMSVDGGATFPHTLATGVTANFVRVTLPNVSASAYGVIRVQSGVDGDYTDGVFALRGTGNGFTNITPGRVFVMGGLERLEWAAPAASRVVDITANGTAIATGLPDRGFFDWIPKDMGATGVTLGITFKQSNGTTVVAGPVNDNNGVTRYRSTITFSEPNTLSPGASQTITATTNSGIAATLSSLTPSICSVSGTTVTALATGTCIVAATQAGNSTYAAAPQVTTSFTISSNPARLFGISTRGLVQTGDNVMIGGFIIGGGTPKTVVVRARGPSLGVAGQMANPTMTIVPAAGGPNLVNDDWQTAANAAQLQSLGFAPGHPQESAVLATLNPGAYTAIVSGVGNTTGVALVEVYEIDAPAVPMVGISTRMNVQTGDNVMIGGFIIQGSGPRQVVVRARGPSLGVAGQLIDPTMTIVPAAGGPNLVNDNWQTDPNAAALSASGFAPGHVNESAILVTLNPGAYTAIVSGVGGTTGVAIVEVYIVN